MKIGLKHARRAAFLFAVCTAGGYAAEPAPQAPLPRAPDAQVPADAPRAAPPQRKRVTDRCYTPAANCILSDRQQAGTSCWCVTPFGPSYGQAR
jgi:hypothetical protein